MDLVVIRNLAFKHLGDRKAHLHREKGFIYYHGQRVAKIAVSLRESLFPTNSSIDRILTVASYFHDVAKGIEPHATYGAVLARELLAEYCDSEDLDKICEVIAYHQFRDKTKSYTESIKIVQDADILDHCGVMEIWMNFQYYAHTNGTIQESLAFYQRKYAQHIKALRELLNYEISKEIFDEKAAFVDRFVSRMALEVEGELGDVR